VEGLDSLPDFTICPATAFKYPKLTFTEKDLATNIFQLKDLFDSQTLTALNDKTREFLFEECSFLFSNLLTIIGDFNRNFNSIQNLQSNGKIPERCIFWCC
jgi:hypothetical protein